MSLVAQKNIEDFLDDEEFLKALYIKDDYELCADFNKGRYKWCQKKCLIAFRCVLIPPMTAMLIYNIHRNAMDTLYYESEWGFWITLITLILQLAAPYKYGYQKAAVIGTELAMALNICIMIMFWTVVGPIYYENWDEYMSTAEGRMEIFELTFVHTVPMIISIIQVIVTDMVWLKKDSIYAGLAGIVYIFFNLAGGTVHGIPMYDYAGLNWKNFWVTFLVYIS